MKTMTWLVAIAVSLCLGSIAQEAAPPPTIAPAAQTEATVEKNRNTANVLNAGTKVKLRFAQSVSSKHAVVGETVELRVAEDVKVGDAAVVPKGARVLGTVTEGKKDEKRRVSKNLTVRVDYIVVGARRVKLTGQRAQKGTVSSGAVTAATVGFGLGGLLVALDQKEAWIREGAEFVGVVAEDVDFGAPLTTEAKSQ